MGPIVTMMRALEQAEAPVCAVVIAGKNHALQTRVRDAAQGLAYPVRVLPFVDNVHEYMHAADLLLTKPGGLTTAEALVAGVPMVLFKPLPGQEERNVRYLTERRAAAKAKTPSELARVVRDLIAKPGRTERMAAAIREIAKPNAAAEIAAIVERLAAETDA